MLEYIFYEKINVKMICRTRTKQSLEYYTNRVYTTGFDLKHNHHQAIERLLFFRLCCTRLGFVLILHVFIYLLLYFIYIYTFVFYRYICINKHIIFKNKIWYFIEYLILKQFLFYILYGLLSFVSIPVTQLDGPKVISLQTQ